MRFDQKDVKKNTRVSYLRDEGKTILHGRVHKIEGNVVQFICGGYVYASSQWDPRLQKQEAANAQETLREGHSGSSSTESDRSLRTPERRAG